LLQYLRPSLSDNDIPHRTKTRDEILERARLAIERVQEKLKHLKTEQLAFTPINGNHSGANIGRILIETIDKYGIRMKVGWFTADNATNNDTAIATVAADIDPTGKQWNAVEHRVRFVIFDVSLEIQIADEFV
ncbi:hypothetical protein CY34DRAFT_102290, partial [Suillus luteus UH-Slu-Lm8-n1]